MPSTIRKSAVTVAALAGKELEVLLSDDFEVVEAREHPARP